MFLAFFYHHFICTNNGRKTIWIFEDLVFKMWSYLNFRQCIFYEFYVDSTTESKIKLENKRGILKMFTLLSEYKTGGKALITQYKEKENARSPGCVCLHSGHWNKTLWSIDKRFCDSYNHLLWYLFFIEFKGLTVA